MLTTGSVTELSVATVSPIGDEDSEMPTLPDTSYGFVLVGDNIDKNFRPSHQREDKRTYSLHGFHSYAVKNHIDISKLSDRPSSAVITAEAFLLNENDIHSILKDFEILVSR